MPVTKIASRWSSGSLIFHEKGDYGSIADLLTIGTGEITVGSATQDVDLKVFLGSATKYVLFNVGTSTLEVGYDDEGVDVKLFGETSGNYLHWDESGDDLLLVGTATQLAVAGDTDAANTTSGSLRTAGGLGVVKKTYMGDDLTLTAGKFLVGSPSKMTITSKSDNDTLTVAEAGIILVTVDAKTMTLPAASGNSGLRYIIKQTAVHTSGVTIEGNASETIDGDENPTSTATYDYLDIVCDGSNWHIIANKGAWS